MKRSGWMGALLGLLGALATGCQSPQATARQEAQRRWNVARAQIKSRLAADQLAEGNVASAATELAEATRLDPDNPAMVPLRARVQLAQGQVAHALELLEHVHLDGAAQAEVDYLRGVALQNEQRWEEALTAFTRAAEEDRGQVEYVVAATQTWLQLDQPKRALDYLVERAGLFAWTDAYQATLAECHEQVGDWSAAAAAWQHVAVAGENPAPLRERIAGALYQAGRWSDATAVLEELVQDCPPDAAVLWRLMLAECYLDAGRLAAAQQQAQAILQTDRRNVPALRLLARSRARAGDIQGALRMAQQVAAMDEQDPRNLELLTGLAWGAGQCELAMATAARLRALEPDNAVAHQLASFSP